MLPIFPLTKRLAVLFILIAASASAETKKVIHYFDVTDGASPMGGLIADSAGNLYGMALGGSLEGGVIYELTPPAPGGAWTETILYNFTGNGHNEDGDEPLGDLTMDSAGNLYGTTFAGGQSAFGTVFQLTPPPLPGGAWTETVLHAFAGDDGMYPMAGLIIDNAGNLYGTTELGGPSANGTVFEVSPPSGGGPWTESVLYGFTGRHDGGRPQCALVFDQAGNLYGTTSAGGANGNYGTVFRLSPPSAGDSWTETVIHRFQQTGGYWPLAGLVTTSSGVLLGTTTGRGDNGENGNVFALVPPPKPGDSWRYHVLHSFAGFPADGALPYARITVGKGGILYGTTVAGGPGNLGTVFQLANSAGQWIETILATGASGIASSPEADVLLLDGSLFGTSTTGGPQEDGTVFRLGR